MTWGKVIKSIIVFGVGIHLGINLVDMFFGSGSALSVFRVTSEITLLIYLSVGGEKDGSKDRDTRTQGPYGVQP